VTVRIVGLVGTVRASRVMHGMGVAKYVALETWVGALWTTMPAEVTTTAVASNDPLYEQPARPWWAWWVP
jgi:hypothetical protein